MCGVYWAGATAPGPGPAAHDRQHGTAMTDRDHPAFDADRRWRLHERVALRPEPFGALAYHYGNRRLTFLRSPDLVALVEQPRRRADRPGRLHAAGIDDRRWPSFEKALTSLAAGDFIVPEESS